MCEGIRQMEEDAAKEATNVANKKAQDEVIRTVYKAMKIEYPEDSEAKTIKFLAKVFNRTQKEIRLLVS